MLEVGRLAPDFSLPNETGEKVKLSALRGKHVVLYFYPKDDTPGCTKEACGFRDLQREFNKVNAVILGVSADSVASHQKFSTKYALPFPLLSDEEKEVVELYGVWKEKNMYGRRYMGIERTTFVIDDSGVIRNIFPKVKVAEHPQRVLEVIENL